MVPNQGSAQFLTEINQKASLDATSFDTWIPPKGQENKEKITWKSDFGNKVCNRLYFIPGKGWLYFQLQVRVAPLAVEVEQQHLMNLVTAFVTTVAPLKIGKEHKR